MFIIFIAKDVGVLKSYMISRKYGLKMARDP